MSYIQPGTALPYSVMGMNVDTDNPDEKAYWSAIGGFSKMEGMLNDDRSDWNTNDVGGTNWKSVFNKVVELFPETYRLFQHYRQHQALLLQLVSLYGRSENLGTLQYLETILARKDGELMAHLRRYSSYRAGYLALLTEKPRFASVDKFLQSYGKEYATISSIGQKNISDAPPSEAYRLQNIADVKSRGYNLNYCVNVLRNAIGVPRQYWEQLQQFYYLYSLALNKVGMASYPGDIGPLASPYWAAQMRDKLSTYGKQCLETNPYRTSGEPYYSAKCFLEGVMLPGVDDVNFYVATRNGTWQRIAESSKRQLGIKPKDSQYKMEQQKFDRGILGLGEYDGSDMQKRIPTEPVWEYKGGQSPGPTAAGNVFKLAGDGYRIGEGLNPPGYRSRS